MSGSSFSAQNWPKKAIVTAGMPYGNKDLHFGHIAGVFIPADCYARFLKDRIGSENVLFISGTDCFGSPIDEGYRKAIESQQFTGSLSEYVQENHNKQKKALDSFDISLSIFEGSGIGEAGVYHQNLSNEFVTRLYENGYLHLRSTMQFFDTEAKTFLNGRQVIGRCPVQGCKSDHGYADECDLGHSYAPEDLIAPISSISGTTPEMRPVYNWYFDLPDFREELNEHLELLKADSNTRSIVPQTCQEFLGAPIIYIKNDEREAFEACAPKLPDHKLREPEKGKASFEVEFNSIDERDIAREILRKEGLRFRTSKALVPFRITGNIEWGVKAPKLDNTDELTIWCWPESLWAPISFTQAVCAQKGLSSDEWKRYWCSPDAEIYQFIGQDNLYFYGVVQPALWRALLPGDIYSHEKSNTPLRQTKLIANYHVLFGKKKASSSGAIKPPSAHELLEHYSLEQLRAHFLALGLDQKSVSFKPKAFEPEEIRQDSRIADPVLKESKLLSNVFNRLARSVLYEAKKNFECQIPLIEPSENVKTRALAVLSRYDAIMKKSELHSIMSCMDDFIRFSNKIWADGISAAEAQGNSDDRKQVLADAAYLLWICTLLMHPVVPRGCEDICEKLQFNPNAFFSWKHEFANLGELALNEEGWHTVSQLEARYDFF